MKIQDIFAKPIDRDIKGVIKVGQGEDENIKQELEEYVVTRELQKHFADFFSSYKRGIVGTTDKMGVWISGFFGSGKSHFLKILSYLLANKVVDGRSAIDYFEKDNKISDNTLAVSPTVVPAMYFEKVTPDTAAASSTRYDKTAEKGRRGFGLRFLFSLCINFRLLCSISVLLFFALAANISDQIRQLGN